MQSAARLASMSPEPTMNAVTRSVTSDASQRALCVAAMLILMAGFFTTALRMLITGQARITTVPCLAPGATGCCCARHRHHHHQDSSAGSSEEDFVGSEDARIQRCVRTTAPNLLVDGTYIHVARIDSCAAQGMDAIAGGTPPADAADQIAACVDAQDFPDALLPFVSDFKDCVKRVLT